MYSPRCFFPWCSRKLPGWSQLFSGSACKGHITHVISKKCQRRQEIQKNPSHLGPLDGVWEERLADIVTPLWRLNYEQQLKVKFEAQKKILQRLESYLQILNGVKVTTAAPKLDGLCCLLHPIIPSPVIDGYRNRSTFSMNRGPDGNPKTVGYYLGTWRDKNIICVQSNNLKNMPQKHSQVAQYYEVFLRQSPLEPCLLFHEGGHWRELTVHTSNQGHTMAIITFYPQELKQHNDPYQLLFGDPYIFEGVLGLKVRISPDAVFQINSAGAEMLYRTAADLSGVNESVIGLSLAHHTSQVLGIAVVEQAVEKARWTSAFNGITNCELHVGRAEKILPHLLKTQEDGKLIVGVVNPARAGLHHRVVQAI